MVQVHELILFLFSFYAVWITCKFSSHTLVIHAYANIFSLPALVRCNQVRRKFNTHITGFVTAANLSSQFYQACSTTARRGALDWCTKFEEANRPVFEALYASVKDGSETRRSLEFNGRKTCTLLFGWVIVFERVEY